MQTTQRQPRVSPAKLGGAHHGHVAMVAIKANEPVINQSITSFREEMSKPKRKHYVPDGIKVVY